MFKKFPLIFATLCLLCLSTLSSANAGYNELDQAKDIYLSQTSYAEANNEFLGQELTLLESNLTILSDSLNGLDKQFELNRQNHSESLAGDRPYQKPIERYDKPLFI